MFPPEIQGFFFFRKNIKEFFKLGIKMIYLLKYNKIFWTRFFLFFELGKFTPEI